MSLSDVFYTNMRELLTFANTYSTILSYYDTEITHIQWMNLTTG